MNEHDFSVLMAEVANMIDLYKFRLDSSVELSMKKATEIEELKDENEKLRDELNALRAQLEGMA